MTFQNQKQKKMKHFALIALTIVLSACGSIKLTDSSYSGFKKAEVERDQYVFQFNKKAGAYLEIVEVKLLNQEQGMDISVPFKVTDKDGKKSIIDLKGRNAFAVVADYPKNNEGKVATSAMIVYKSERDGKNKYYTVKKIGEE